MLNLIRKKYPEPAYVVLAEVRDGVGFEKAGREADAMAFGVWPSRGLEVLGFEVKSYRNDWLRELKNPAKAEGIAQYCDQWWLVTEPNVAKLEELPPAWGWYEKSAKDILKLMKPATVFTAKPLDRTFIMSIVRNVSRSYVAKAQVAEEIEAKAKVMMEQRRQENDFRLENLEALQKRVKVFEEKSGIDLDSEWEWPGEETGKLVKELRDLSLLHHAENIARSATKLQEVIELLKKIPLLQETLKNDHAQP